MLVRNDGPSLVVNTPAKLNLFLEVLGRRPDGYHELETVMVSIGLYDTLLFSEDETHQTRLRCHCLLADESLPTGEENLILRAAQRLRDVTGCDRGVRIDLWKRIPLQAGLGGGSSDAAATLIGLNRFWKLGLKSAELHTLAASLGSDVNFFLDSRCAAACRGRGERIAPLTVPERMHFVVVCPHTGLSTAEVFRHWSDQDLEKKPLGKTVGGRVSSEANGPAATSGPSLRSRPGQPDVFRPSLDKAIDLLTTGRHRIDPTGFHNALEAPARSLNADVSQVLQMLRDDGRGPVLMSGSGTACFAVCRTAREARQLAGRLRHLKLGQVFALDLRA